MDPFQKQTKTKMHPSAASNWSASWWLCDREWELLLHREEGRNLRENILQTEKFSFLLHLQQSVVPVFCSHYLSSCC